VRPGSLDHRQLNEPPYPEVVMDLGYRCLVICSSMISQALSA
jgi:hypothetical protein